MAVFRLAASPKGAAAAAIIADLDTPATPWYGEVYAGTIPAAITDAISTQTKLGTVTGSTDPSATHSGGLITFNPMTEDSAADVTGTASFMRIFTGDGTPWADMDMGNLESDCTGKMNTTSVVVGGPIRINAFTISVG